MVRAAGTPPAPGGVEAPEPTWGYLARRGVPTFAAEGVLPILVLYGAWHLFGLTAGIVFAAVVSAFVVVWQIRRGHDAPVARITLVFLAVQAAIGIASHSATVYLAQPIVLSAGWGMAYLVSAGIGRPLVGLFAQAWYPFPRWFRQTDPFKRVYGIQSLVWGAYFLVRSGVRLAVLLNGSLESFLLTVFLTGAPMMFLLIVWSIRHSIRGLADADVDPPDLTPSGRGATLDGEHTFVTLPDPGDANADRPTAGDLEVPHGLRRRARVSANGA